MVLWIEVRRDDPHPLIVSYLYNINNKTSSRRSQRLLTALKLPIAQPPYRLQVFYTSFLHRMSGGWTLFRIMGLSSFGPMIFLFKGYMRLKLYLSGKITGDPHYKDKFKIARLELEAAGYEVVDPSTFGFPDTISWEKAMRFDIKKLLCSDAVAVLPDWQESRGAIIEAGLALDLGMKVQEVKKWIIVLTAEKK